MTIQIKDMGLRNYAETYAAMRNFNNQRQSTTIDQIWLLEHPPVYTLGLSATGEHLLNTGTIPVIKTDRGGQVTYHGPGQLIAYLLIDLNRRPYRVKKLISSMEQSVIDYLREHDIQAERKAGAPGVYIQGEKVAALGVRVRQGRTYHGLAFNIDMDLEPFKGVNPCGYAGLRCTQLANIVKNITVAQVKARLPEHLFRHLDQAAKALSDAA